MTHVFSVVPVVPVVRYTMSLQKLNDFNSAFGSGARFSKALENFLAREAFLVNLYVKQRYIRLNLLV